MNRCVIRFLRVYYRGLTIAQWLLIAAVLMMIAVGYYGVLTEGPGEMYPDELRRAR